ncbi:two-component system, chemotaxis family, sensor kinase CheA [Nitrosomonas eutropha]|uniref:chemotaxis protein CheA n=1 Tax=Nitrosomonas TaxID=914 RepID=UPI00089933AD|nr:MULTISPECIES: chemotaxis protein CheA [Nitrosomonas]MXS80036.1 chemotaxis protein CheA [Nitrosomonas sp. GH22]SDV99663.1 two-component system, chemotaxis family, sensor kinase CheA [Nitrosomonas eutropha]
MSTDLEQFYQIFFEEAGELLAEMETRLLKLDILSPDPEDLNAIFRVAHSIKGGAGTFGFTDMTELTHVLESLLDKLRKDELKLRAEMVDTFLRAGDVLKNQLDGHRGTGSADPAEVDAVNRKLKELVADTVGNSATSTPESVEESAPHTVNTSEQAPVSTESASVAENVTTYRIEFGCADLGKSVMEKLLIDLARQGQLKNLSDPDNEAICILQLATTDSEEDVWEALAFLVDPANLSIKIDESALPAADIPGATLECRQEQQQTVETISEQQDMQLSEAVSSPTAANSATQKTQLPAKKAVAPPQHKPSADHAVSASGESSSIRVGVEKVDQMINLVGELVITQAMLAQTASQIDPVIFEKLLNGLNQLERNTRDLQEAVMSIRMMPISFVFSRFPRVVRDVASKLGKQVDLKTLGEGTELDKGLIEKITDPLTHLIRNSLDHGIETPEKRKALGKPAHGTITLRASHQGGSVVIEVMDDGAGLNREKILDKARSRGLAISENMTDQDVWMLIFEAGFSTAEVVTDVSGRGVGMDVVKRNIEGLGGRVEIDSITGQRTKISIRLPLTLAILDGLSVSVGDQLFIIPLTYITESLKPAAEDIRTIRGQGRVVEVRGEYLPVIALHEIFGLEPEVHEIHEGILVILDAEGNKAAMFVDTLVGQHQVVIKSLESNYRRVQGVSGATIMGDGSVALILDAVGLVNVTKQRMIHAA